MHPVILRSPRWVLALFVVVLTGTTTMAVPAVRTAILRAAGWVLVVDEPVEPADMIVVTVDAGTGGLVEAADLVHSGTATRVAVFSDPPDELDRALIGRGVPYDDAAVRSIRQLRWLGVVNVEQVPQAVAGTEDEGRVLADWFDRRSFRSVVVVSTPDHSRRIRRVLRRSMKGSSPRLRAGHQTKVMVRVARYSQFDPDRWWRTRVGLRTGIIELEKLLLDFARHPIA